MRLTNWIADIATIHPNRHALVTEDGPCTYHTLDTFIGAMRKELRANTFRVDRVMCRIEDQPLMFLVQTLAALSIGRRIMPMPRNLKPATRLAILDKLDKTKPVDTDMGGLVYMTSGSTGASKLILRSPDSIDEEARSVSEGLGIVAGSAVCVTTPLSHSFGFGVAIATLRSGATLYVSNRDHFAERLKFARTVIEAHDPSIVTGVPFIFKMLLRNGTVHASEHLRSYAGGETLTRALSESWRRRTGSALYQEYGLSEVGICSASGFGAPPWSIGEPMPGVSLTLTDEGEIVSKRKHSPTSYYFGENPETFDNDGVHTGDLAFQDSDGWYHLMGRTKNIINIAGMKVTPGEIEHAIRMFQGVEEAAVVGIVDDMRGEFPVAYVTTESHIEKTDLAKYLRDGLESYKVPAIVLCEELPRTPSGKVDRERLKQTYV